MQILTYICFMAGSVALFVGSLSGLIQELTK